MTRKLDRSASFGEIYGDPEGRCFEQEGRFFNAAGEEVPPTTTWDSAAEAIDAPPRKKSGRKLPPTATVEPAAEADQLSAQLLD